MNEKLTKPVLKITKEVQLATCVVLDASASHAMEQVMDNFIWNGIREGILDDPENNSPFEHYSKDSIATGKYLGFGVYPLVDGYLLHMNCLENKEQMVIMTHQHLDYEPDIMYDAIKYHVLNHLDISIDDVRHPGHEPLGDELKAYLMGPVIKLI